MDNAGNTSSTVDSSTWQVVKISGTPYDGQGLPPVTSLGNNTLSNTTLTNTTRSAPSEANILTITGTVSWNTTGHTAVFLRANELILSQGAIIHANGEDASSITGAKGGSGGGGGGNGGANTGGNGGSSGASGGAGSGAGFGAGGSGTAALYNTGFTYGNGGDGTKGGDTNLASGGTGGNGAGGGGGGI